MTDVQLTESIKSSICHTPKCFYSKSMCLSHDSSRLQQGHQPFCMLRELRACTWHDYIIKINLKVLHEMAILALHMATELWQLWRY